MTCFFISPTIFCLHNNNKTIRRIPLAPIVANRAPVIPNGIKYTKSNPKGILDNSKEIKPFEMRTDSYTDGEYSYLNAWKSSTIRNLYLSMIIMLGGLFIYLKFINCVGD